MNQGESMTETPTESSSLPPSIFASHSVVEHVLRGVVGIATLVIAVSISSEQPGASLVLAGVSLLAFRGCPICWTIGLVEMGWRRLRNPAQQI